MNNMEDVYKKIIDQYKSLDVKLNDDEEIIIKTNDKEIKAYKDGVLYYYKGEGLAHSHDETYEEVYESIEYYLEKEPDYFIKMHKKDQIIKWIIIITLALILSIIKEFINK